MSCPDPSLSQIMAIFNGYICSGSSPSILSSIYANSPCPFSLTFEL